MDSTPVSYTHLDVYKRQSLDPTFTVTVGLCLSNALTALSGAMVGQYQKTVDINSGTGIVVIGLACLIIGETVLGRRTVYKGILAALVGSVVYRFIYAVVFYTKVVPVECLKLLTAVIVALAIAAPGLRRWAAFQKQKHSRKAVSYTHLDVYKRQVQKRSVSVRFPPPRRSFSHQRFQPECAP